MRLFHQFVRFAAVGLSGTAVQYSVLWVGVECFGAQRAAAAASAVGYLCGSLCNYLLNRMFTFKGNHAHTRAAPRYFMVIGGGWLINTSLMAWWVQHLHWNTWLAQMLATAIGLAWNFSGSRWWAFRHRPH